MADEFDGISKPNRRVKQDPKPHKQVMSRPLGVPEWMRDTDRRKTDKKIADVSKRARKSQKVFKCLSA